MRSTFGPRPGMVSVAILLATNLEVSLQAFPDSETGGRTNQDALAQGRTGGSDVPLTGEPRVPGARKGPVIYRFSTNATADAETAFRSSFGDARERFLDQLEAVLGKRTLPEELIAQARFRNVVTAFQEQEKLFPLSLELARLWAGGKSGELVREEWGTILRAAMGRLMQSDSIPPESGAGVPFARLIPAQAPKRMSDPARLEGETLEIVPSARIAPLSLSRSELIRRFPPQDLATARFLAGFLRENCVFDQWLSAQLQEPRTEGAGAAEVQQAGQTATKQEDAGRARTLFATNQDRSRLHSLAGHPSVPDRSPLKLGSDMPSPLGLNRWILAVGMALLGILGAGWIRFRGRSKAVTVVRLAPMGSSHPRLIAAGSGWFMRRLVETWLAERRRWWAVQDRAEWELAELEERLARARAPLEARLEAYERRIAELENQLAKKGEENRELLQATISTARQRLERERSRGRLALN